MINLHSIKYLFHEYLTGIALATPTLIFATALQLDDFQSSHSIHHYH